MLNPDEKELIAFIQDHASTLPIEKRIRVYRGLADSLEHAEVRDLFVERARILEEANRRCRELDLKFDGGAK